MRRSELQISVAWHLRKSWRASALLKRVARHVAVAEGFRTGELSIAVVGAAAMSALHRRFRGEPGPTDVLTFDLGTDRRRRYLDGEIVACAAVALSSGSSTALSARGSTLAQARRELALYVAHGVLHLAGYDDQTPRGYSRMHAREDELLVELGLGAVCGAA